MHTPRCSTYLKWTIVLEKLIVTQLVRFLALYGARRFITMFTRAHHRSLSITICSEMYNCQFQCYDLQLIACDAKFIIKNPFLVTPVIRNEERLQKQECAGRGPQVARVWPSPLGIETLSFIDFVGSAVVSRPRSRTRAWFSQGSAESDAALGKLARDLPFRCIRTENGQTERSSLSLRIGKLKLCLYLTKHHAMKTYWGVEV
jgi:hypothetical protein